MLAVEGISLFPILIPFTEQGLWCALLAYLPLLELNPQVETIGGLRTVHSVVE